MDSRTIVAIFNRDLKGETSKDRVLKIILSAKRYEVDPEIAQLTNAESDCKHYVGLGLFCDFLFDNKTTNPDGSVSVTILAK